MGEHNGMHTNNEATSLELGTFCSGIPSHCLCLSGCLSLRADETIRSPVALQGWQLPEQITSDFWLLSLMGGRLAFPACNLLCGKVGKVCLLFCQEKVCHSLTIPLWGISTSTKSSAHRRLEWSCLLFRVCFFKISNDLRQSKVHRFARESSLR